MEEVGLIFGVFWLIIQYLLLLGGIDEVVYLFVGCCDSEGVGGVYGLLEEGEDICVYVWLLEDVLQVVCDGWINNVVSIIVLQWLVLNWVEVCGLWV